MISWKNNRMLAEAREARFQPNPILQILVFVMIFAVGSANASLVSILPMLIGMLADQRVLEHIVPGDPESSMAATMSIMNEPWVMLISLFATAVTTAICLLYCRLVERRSFASMGFRKQGWLSRYLKGYAIGTAMLLLCALILWLTGDLDFAFAEKIPVIYLAAFFVGFLIQGMSEEVLVRGYFMVSLGNRCHMAIAVVISSVAFAMLHLLNPGITLLALVNLTLFGVFMAVYILRTDDLLGACAIHSAWNFAQGNLVGIQVSGLAPLPTVAVMEPVGENPLLHGGSFGLEGGLIVTLVLLIAIVLTIALPQMTRRGEPV